MMTREDKLVKEVVDDFKRRAEERRSFDLIWQINSNFLMGNQYCSVGYGGELEEQERQFFWQEREVFNHIAPVFDIRFAKLSKVKPEINILPASNDEKDKQIAKISKKIYQSVKNKLELNEKINQAIKWSEVCGTVFYKIGWNSKLGQVVGIGENDKKITSGEVEISVVSPFEIYPDCSTCEGLDECQSLIHAKAYKTSQIKSMFGVDVEGGDVNVFSLDGINGSIGGLGFNGTMQKIVQTKKTDSAVVIEKYVRPCVEHPNGRLTIVAGDKLVFDGDLPYLIKDDKERDFPFIRQTSIEQPGCFWGTSVIERLIPVQRAFNAVKNRKHEFINRISMGVLSVEDGSVDLENLEQDGLCPGKVLVYRQGAKEPQYLQSEAISGELGKEEEALLEEFNKISGVSDILSINGVSSNMSGVALEIMLSQDETRLNASVEQIKIATKAIAKKILKLYKQFAVFPRLARIVGDNGDVEIFYFSSSDITSDDIIIEDYADQSQTLSQRRDMVFELLKNGILTDEKGLLSTKMKAKVMEMLGIGAWETAQDINELHIKKADKENFKLLDGININPSEIDDHELHINEHIAFMLGEDFEKRKAKNSKIEGIFLAHIKAHKSLKEE